MRLGDTANTDAQRFGKPLDGVRILAAEQMQALPYATQLLARLGAEVVKVEHPVHGESGRGSTPAMTDPEGRAVGATYLRNNLGKRSLGIDLKSAEGRDLFLALVPRFDVIAENFKAGTMQRLGLGYEVIAEQNPRAIYVSLSGFGDGYADAAESPYRDWPAYASIVEAMSGIYEWKAGPDRPPVANPVGALGDISSALFATIGILAALRHRDTTGLGQYVDIAMLDAVIAMTDVVANFWSLGVRPEPGKGLQIILDGFGTADGYVVVQVVREHQFEKLADLVGRPEWKDDPRFATRAGWAPNLEAVIRPAVEAWAKQHTKLEATRALTAVGIAAGPSNSAPDLIADPHVAIRNMLVEMPRTDTAPDGSPLDPVLIPGNPVKMSKVAEGPETRVPWVGEHTAEVLRAELDLSDVDIAKLREAGVVN